MNKTVFAICDCESDFVFNFMEYFIRKGIIDIDIKAFTEVGNLKKYLEENTVDLLLIINNLIEDVVDNPNINKIIIMSEGEVSKKYGDFPVIFKYQSSENIISELMNCYAESVNENYDTALYRLGVKLIGIYSPVKRSKKTSFAITMSQLIAEREKVLYLNMEEFSGLFNFLIDNLKGDILDLIYFERHKNGNSVFKLRSMVNRINNVDYVSPAFFSEDLKRVEAEEWLELLDKIISRGGYETIILDLGETINGLIDILEKCTSVYMPIRNDFISIGKVQQFEDYLNGICNKKLLDKIIKIELPEVERDINCNEYFDYILRSEFGDMVRKIIMEKTNEGR